MLDKTTYTSIAYCSLAAFLIINCMLRAIVWKLGWGTVLPLPPLLPDLPFYLSLLPPSYPKL
jgi:hypothetical protein